VAFTSLSFVVFFLFVYAAYRLLPPRAQNPILLVASYAFYAAWDWRFVGLLAGITLVNYGAALAMGRTDRQAPRRVVLGCALVFNLALLAVFKYWGFFTAGLQELAGLAGWHLDAFTVNILLPVGISFYTFVATGYVIDVYRRTCAAEHNPATFALFIAFFPTLISGPIQRATGLLPQLATPRRLTPEHLAGGAWLVLWGAFKKIYVADNLAHVVAGVFGADAAPAGFDVVLGTLAFALQVYGDFSGYTDIARGTSMLLGIELPANFRFPYFVRTPQDFWSNWHISLSEWLRDYLFLPVSYPCSRRLEGVRWFGLREDFWTYASATAVTMVLAGLWHGAAWTFVAWGAYQALLLIVFRAFAVGRRRKRLRRSSATARPGLHDVPAMAGMFMLTCYGWLIFRADSLAQVGTLTACLVTAFHPSLAALSALGTPLLLYGGPLALVHILDARAGQLDAVRRWPPVARYSACVAFVYLIVLLGDFQGSDFIYFQF
jgi:alginate O-acetyltransferase complex protein AlgI